MLLLKGMPHDLSVFTHANTHTQVNCNDMVEDHDPFDLRSIDMHFEGADAAIVQEGMEEILLDVRSSINKACFVNFSCMHYLRVMRTRTATPHAAVPCAPEQSATARNGPGVGGCKCVTLFQPHMSLHSHTPCDTHVR